MRKIKKHIVSPDPIHNSELVAKLINYVMRNGKKNAAQKIVYRVLDLIKEKTKADPLKLLELAIENAAPLLEIRPKRIGGATYQVPSEVKGQRRIALSIRWMLNAARSKKGRPMAEKLFEEIMQASNNEGSAIKKKMDTHRMAEANRAFAHFAR